jgi:hypothetical protein
MAGALTISTLNNDTGVLATQNGMTGIAKSWANYNGLTQTLNNSFNISSVTYISTGDYTFNFTTAMPNANYSLVCSTLGNTGLASATTLTTTSATINVVNSVNGSPVNTPTYIAIFSS